MTAVTTSILDLINRPHLDMRPKRPRMTVSERIARNTRIDANGCWVWTGRLTNCGYGHFTYMQIGYKTETFVAHRVSYEISKGRIPDGMQLDHLCRNRACVNPDHLEPVTALVNVARARSAAWELASVDTCLNGHDLTDPSNVYRWHKRPGARMCKKCNAERARAYKARKAAEARS